MHLHVTNGDAAAGHLRLLVGAAPVLAWRDVLHEGPVPAGLGRIELSAVRALFIASCGWAPLAEALAGFRRRDGLLAALGPADSVTLWFEHDLYDQLQLVEVLDALADLLLPPAAIGLVQAGVYLSGLSVAELASLRTSERPVSPDQLALARRAWAAFRSPCPSALLALVAGDTRPLPFLGTALRRLLEELPAPTSGLARTERQALGVLAQGPMPARDLYGAAQAMEPALFMGDWPFYRWLGRLAAAPAPLLAGWPSGAAIAAPGPMNGALGAPFTITDAGLDVLAGSADRIAMAPPDRWLGGTHLRPGNVWRFDPASSTLARDQAGGDAGSEAAAGSA